MPREILGRSPESLMRVRSGRSLTFRTWQSRKCLF